MNMPWFVKYRPTTLAEYIWRDAQLQQNVKKWLGGSLPNVLFFGPSGVGKTALTELIIQQMNVDESDVLKLNASVDNNAETMRTTILNFCETGGWGGQKIVFLNEADNITHSAQQMLRGIMDDFPAVRFLLTANYVHRILPEIKSRFTEVLIESLDEEAFLGRLMDILAAENVVADDSVVMEIFESTFPDMRRALNALEAAVVDGKLSRPEKVSKTKEWEGELKAVLKNFDVNRARALVTSFRRDEIVGVYKFLCDNSSMFAAEKEAIIAIADGEYRHSLVSFPEINLMATLINLSVCVEAP